MPSKIKIKHLITWFKKKSFEFSVITDLLMKHQGKINLFTTKYLVCVLKINIFVSKEAYVKSEKVTNKCFL